MKKILSFILTLILVVCAIPVGAMAADGDDDGLKLQNIDYKELIGRVNQADAGFTISSKYIYSSKVSETTAPMDDSGYQFYYIDLGRYSSNRGNTDKDIDQWFLDYLDQSLANLRNNGGGCIIRCSYANDGQREAEPSTFAQLTKHQKQLSKVFRKYSDIIVAVECGMAGAFGEMWGGLYSEASYKAQILDTWLNNLPDEIPVNVRTVSEYTYYINYSDVWAEKYKKQTVNGVEYPTIMADHNYSTITFPEGEIFNRIGIYNDAMIQDGNDGGTMRGARDDFNSWMSNRAKTASYGGEFSGAKEYRYLSNIWMPMNAIPEFYKTHLNYYHGGNAAYENTGKFKYGDTFEKTYDTAEEAQEKADKFKSWYEEEKLGSGMTYDVKVDGTKVTYTTGGWASAKVDDALIAEIAKNTDLTADLSAYKGQSVASYFEDHLGYRIVLKSSYLSNSVAKGGVLALKGSVDNTGFANISRDKVTEIVLTNGEKTYVTRTKIDANSWYSGSRNEYDITLKLPASIDAGEYTVYMRVAGEDNEGNTSVKGCVRFANAGEYEYSVPGSSYSVGASKVNIIYNEEIGGNYLGTFTVTEETTKASDDSFKQVTTSFKDVDDSFWGKAPITSVCSLGLMSGMSGTTFEPNTTTSRAMLVQVLYNMEGGPDVSEVNVPFTDIGDTWYTKAIKWAYSNKVVAGMTATTFGPMETLTREQFAAILFNFANYKKMDVDGKADLSKFSDADRISSYAEPALSWANHEGLITGHANTTLIDPRGSATRAQMASILYRYINLAFADQSAE